MNDELEMIACQPYPVDRSYFNPNADLPYDCQAEHIFQAMNEFVAFLGFINQQLYSKGIERLEVMMMPANFSSMVGEFMISNIPKYCNSLVKNKYHNGHPDLIPAGMFPNNVVQHSKIGIEIKGFLADFGDLGWGKAEGRGQRAEGGRRKKDIIKLLTSNFRLQTYDNKSQCWR